MKETSIVIDDYLLQRDRMKLIDSVISVDEQKAITLARPTRQWPLLINDRIQSLIMVELIAQTAGINIRWNELQENPEKAEGSGMIVGIKSADFLTDHITMDSNITVQADKICSTMGYAEYSGVCSIDGDKLGEVIIQVYRTE